MNKEKGLISVKTKQTLTNSSLKVLVFIIQIEESDVTCLGAESLDWS